MTLVEFLLARIAEDERDARIAAERADGDDLWVVTGMDNPVGVDYLPARVLAECEAKRRIIEWHKNWPVLVEKAPTFEPSLVADDLTSATYRMSRQIAWLTDQEYRNRFGSESPAGPILLILALPYADHPDYRAEWRP